jgi:hypothetical protein
MPPQERDWVSLKDQWCDSAVSPTLKFNAQRPIFKVGQAIDAADHVQKEACGSLLLTGWHKNIMCLDVLG